MGDVRAAVKYLLYELQVDEDCVKFRVYVMTSHTGVGIKGDVCEACFQCTQFFDGLRST